MHSRELHVKTMNQMSFIFQKESNCMSPHDEKMTDEIIEKFSDLLDDLATDD